MKGMNYVPVFVTMETKKATKSRTKSLLKQKIFETEKRKTADLLSEWQKVYMYFQKKGEIVLDNYLSDLLACLLVSLRSSV